MERKQVKVKGNRWCQIEVRLTEGNLAVSGVFGSEDGELFFCADGKQRRAESFGQITDKLKEFFPEYAALLPWHLNAMRPNCSHQTGPAWDTAKKIEIVTYSLTSAARQERKEIMERATASRLANLPVQLAPEQSALLRLPEQRMSPPDADDPGSGQYDVTKRETKLAGWVYPSEHAAGILCKPCPVCGYKYGSAWLREELPAEITQLAKSVGNKE